MQIDGGWRVGGWTSIRRNCWEGPSVRILTGAPLPEGTDLVVMQEAYRVDGICVLIQESATGNTNRRVRDGDVGLGSRAIGAGARLR